MSANKSDSMSVFGVRPENAISLPNSAYSVRLNCKDGGLFVGGAQDIHRRTKSNECVEVAIIRVVQFYGSLGLEYVGQWLQVFFVPGPNVDAKVLPKNTVCVFYIKKQNIAALYNCVQDAMSEKDPGMGIFTVGFEKQSGRDGSAYYTVNFSWRERSGAEEENQLTLLSAFLATNPNLIDLEGTRAMQCLEGLTPEQVSAITSGANNLPSLPPSR